MIDFSVNSNPFGPAPAVLDAIRNAKVARYPDKECLALRAALSDQIGVGMMPQWAGEDLPIGETVGFIERWARAQTGAQLEYSRTWFDPARARYVARLT